MCSLADTASFSRRGNGQKNRKVSLETLKSNLDNTICPIKLLLIMALRLGNVHAKTIDEVLSRAADRGDKTVQWVHPERPVLCAFGNVGSSILESKAAGNHQLTHTMAQAAPISGFLKTLRGHDLRYGAARDTANLSSSIKGYATTAVAAVLGHSEQSHLGGVTAKYVGHIKEVVWSKRVEENFQDPFDVATTDDVFVKRRKLTPAQITEMCVSKGLDPKSEKDRKKAGQMQRAKVVEDWAAGQASRVIGDTTSPRGMSFAPSNTPSGIY